MSLSDKIAVVHKAYPDETLETLKIRDVKLAVQELKDKIGEAASPTLNGPVFISGPHISKIIDEIFGEKLL